MVDKISTKMANYTKDIFLANYLTFYSGSRLLPPDVTTGKALSNSKIEKNSSLEDETAGQREVMLISSIRTL